MTGVLIVMASKHSRDGWRRPTARVQSGTLWRVAWRVAWRTSCQMSGIYGTFASLTCSEEGNLTVLTTHEERIAVLAFNNAFIGTTVSVLVDEPKPSQLLTD